MADAQGFNVKQQAPAEIVHAQPDTITASGVTMQRSGTIQVAGAAAGVALTFGYDTLQVGQELLIVNTSSDYSLEVTLPDDVTWDGTNDLATFADAGDALLVRAISPTRFFIVANVGSVALS